MGQQSPESLQVKVVHLPVIEELWRDQGLCRVNETKTVRGLVAQGCGCRGNAEDKDV